MNDGHAALCASPDWAEHIAGTVLPAALGRLDLGTEVLEIGPGYGASTAVLARAVVRLTAVEVDAVLADDLRTRFPGTTVVHGSGSALPFDDGSFDAVVCFTMLHHVATTRMQDELFEEARRVLRSDGVFAGSDSIANPGLRDFHGDDTYVPVDPDGLGARLRAAGFARADVRIAVPDEWFTFAARP